MTSTSESLAYTDGNALAGPLADLFAIDITDATTSCVGCGGQSAVAELHLYTAGPGFVARCPHCQDPVLRYVRTPSTAILDLRGTVRLEAPLAL